METMVTYIVAAVLLLSLTLLCVGVGLLSVCVYADRARRRRLTSLSHSLEVVNQKRHQREAGDGGGDDSGKTLEEQLIEERRRTTEYKTKLRAVERQSYEQLRIQILKEEEIRNEQLGAKKSKGQIIPQDDVAFTEQNATTGQSDPAQDAAALPTLHSSRKAHQTRTDDPAANEQVVPLTASMRPASVSANSTTGRQTHKGFAPLSADVPRPVPPFDATNRRKAVGGGVSSSLASSKAHSLQIGSCEDDI